jgi:outer membrane protein TolC
MARSNLEAAEENLRTADIGYKEGVINANTALGAHTAWLQAQSEYIDAGIELQMLAANLNKAEGNYGSNGQGAVQDAMNE